MIRVFEVLFEAHLLLRVLGLGLRFTAKKWLLKEAHPRCFDIKNRVRLFTIENGCILGRDSFERKSQTGNSTCNS